MATISGTWTIRAIKKTADWKQGISITGSAAHNGIFELLPGDELNNVRGSSINIEIWYFDPTFNDWKKSLQREHFEWKDEIGLTLTIAGDDNVGSGDYDFDDFVVLCVPEDDILKTPIEFPRPDFTIPKEYIAGSGYKKPLPGRLTLKARKELLASIRQSVPRKPR